MKAHLLFPDRDFDWSSDPPTHSETLQHDLELPILIRSMSGGDQFVQDMSSRVLLCSVTEPEAIRHRQQVLDDFLRHPEVLTDLYGTVTAALSDGRSLWGYSWSYRSPSPVLSGARQYLEMYLTHLRGLRTLADRYTRVVRSAGLTALFAEVQDQLDDDYFASVEGHLRRLRFDGGILISARLGKDNSGVEYVLRAPEREKPRLKERLGLAPRTAFSFTLPPRDHAGAQALDDLRNRGLNQVANAVAQSADHIKDYFDSLRRELAFYVGCTRLARRLEELGVPTCFPEIDPVGSRTLACTELRDPCLALQSLGPVVGNDLDAEGKPVVVITGANSGGKSTFLRSMGVMQLMAQAGMFVTARRCRVSLCTAVLTHFPREEDQTMTRGRLEEELARVAEMAPLIRMPSLILFNESFHSTNEREGSEIARQIVRALVDTRNRVAFVTHQYDFANSMVRTLNGQVLSLRSELGPDGVPNFRLTPDDPLPTAYGTVLYRKIFPEAEP